MWFSYRINCRKYCSCVGLMWDLVQRIIRQYFFLFLNYWKRELFLYLQVNTQGGFTDLVIKYTENDSFSFINENFWIFDENYCFPFSQCFVNFSIYLFLFLRYFKLNQKPWFVSFCEYQQTFVLYRLIIFWNTHNSGGKIENQNNSVDRLKAVKT